MLRELKLRRITNQVRAGTYKIDAAKVADSMLKKFRKEAKLSAQEWREFLAEEDA